MHSHSRKSVPLMGSGIQFAPFAPLRQCILESLTKTPSIRASVGGLPTQYHRIHQLCHSFMTDDPLCSSGTYLTMYISLKLFTTLKPL